MTGRYLIYTPAESKRDEKRFDAAWRRFAEVCRLLHQDGLSYRVEFNLTDARPNILITASGKTTAKRKPASVRRMMLPARVKAEQCAVHAQEAAWFMPENRERRNANTTHWRTRAGRYAELNAMAEEHLRAELEYWPELELLSGQREHFKPGRTDETAYLDDEVAA
jgi:hypothetical protein